MNRFIYYWKRTKYTTSWEVAYRKRNTKTILSDLESPFSVLQTNKKSWLADPFLFTYKGKDFLFTECYSEEEKKGSIAVSVETSEGFSLPQIVIDKSIHLSFPCVFCISSKIFMIPETGQDKSIELFEAVDFPYKWEKVKTLMNEIDSSDTIVWTQNNTTYVLASVLQGNARTAKNMLFSLDEESLELSFIQELKNTGTRGIRNAGSIFCENNTNYRPGQNCDDGEYGKGLIFWKVNNCTKDYQEEYFKEIRTSDININNECVYCGVHTYNLTDRYEVIDLKINKRNPLILRIVQIMQIIIDYFLHR